MLFMPFVRADQSAIWFVQNCQPEKLKKVYVINAPKAFTLVWACYKIFIDKKTRDKVSILGSNFMGGKSFLLRFDQTFTQAHLDHTRTHTPTHAASTPTFH